jgi:hypothetical protein
MVGEWPELNHRDTEDTEKKELSVPFLSVLSVPLWLRRVLDIEWTG